LVWAALVLTVRAPQTSVPVESALGRLVVLALGAVALFLAIGTIGLIMLPVSTMMSRLLIGPGGIVYSRWPFRRIVCQWSELDHLASTTVLGRNATMLYVRRSAPGWSLRMGPGILGSREYKIIPLSDFKGWSDARILHDISEYVPRLPGISRDSE
jgi:hypothetical protein